MTGFDDQDVAAILAGIFHLNGKLAQINAEVRAIRILMEDGDEEEEGQDAEDE